MLPFTFVQPQNTEEAVRNREKDGQYIAGGTNLVDFMKLNIETPSQVIDINRLPLTEIKQDGDHLRIGAMVRNSDLAYHAEIKQAFPVLSEALLAGANAQIRNMASVGGNLLQRTRCTYFRDTAWPCNKREPGSGCSAIEGYNHSHAILGTSEHCIATHPSDMCVALTALDAVIEIQTATGLNKIPITEFYVPYGEDPATENKLQPGDLITAVQITQKPLSRNSLYLKVRDRASFEFALASAAVALHVEQGTIREARLALGGVATKPWRALAAEQKLVGLPLDDQSFQAAAQIALQDAKPQKHNAFKVELARRTVIRAFHELAQRIAQHNV